MKKKVDVIFLDKSPLESTFKDLGVDGLEVYVNRAQRVFVGPELTSELFPNIQIASSNYQNKLHKLHEMEKPYV